MSGIILVITHITSFEPHKNPAEVRYKVSPISHWRIWGSSKKYEVIWLKSINNDAKIWTQNCLTPKAMATTIISPQREDPQTPLLRSPKLPGMLCCSPAPGLYFNPVLRFPWDSLCLFIMNLCLVHLNEYLVAKEGSWDRSVKCKCLRCQY